MRTWEQIDRADLEKKYGKQETEQDWIELHKKIHNASIKLADEDKFEYSDALDDELIVIEQILLYVYAMSEQELMEKTE